MKIFLCTLSLFLSTSIFAQITKDERVLLIISDLQTHGVNELQGLYKIIENLAAKLPKKHLTDKYKTIIVLKKEMARLDSFTAQLHQLALDESIKAIDVIVGLHGNKNKIYFVDKAYTSQEIKTSMLNESNYTPTQLDLLKQKLRLMYNLSCYGESLNQTFFDIGFDVSVGSIKVNANAEIEYGHVLKKWSNNQTLNDAFLYPNSQQMLKIADEPLRAIGETFNNFLKETDSTKYFLGNTLTTIDSESF